ncbi:MAG: hypothetical protein HZB68_01385 [Candidatus Aenigmarchaeota archaeon]|nr:hypothetical protein [Candidatus Aenigmarchaeota archaeon]
MGLFGFKHKSSMTGTEYFLHLAKGRGGIKLYYFSKEEAGAIGKPAGYEVVENPRTGHPFLRKLRGESNL